MRREQRCVGQHPSIGRFARVGHDDVRSLHSSSVQPKIVAPGDAEGERVVVSRAPTHEDRRTALGTERPVRNACAFSPGAAGLAWLGYVKELGLDARERLSVGGARRARKKLLHPLERPGDLRTTRGNPRSGGLVALRPAEPARDVFAPRQRRVELDDDFPRGTFFVELAPVRDSRLPCAARKARLVRDQQLGAPAVRARLRRSLRVLFDRGQHALEPSDFGAEAFLQLAPPRRDAGGFFGREGAPEQLGVLWRGGFRFDGDLDDVVVVRAWPPLGTRARGGPDDPFAAVDRSNQQEGSAVACDEGARPRGRVESKSHRDRSATRSSLEAGELQPGSFQRGAERRLRRRRTLRRRGPLMTSRCHCEPRVREHQRRMRRNADLQHGETCGRQPHFLYGRSDERAHAVQQARAPFQRQLVVRSGGGHGALGLRRAPGPRAASIEAARTRRATSSSSFSSSSAYCPSCFPSSRPFSSLASCPPSENVYWWCGNARATTSRAP